MGKISSVFLPFSMKGQMIPNLLSNPPFGMPKRNKLPYGRVSHLLTKHKKPKKDISIHSTCNGMVFA